MTGGGRTVVSIQYIYMSSSFLSLSCPKKRIFLLCSAFIVLRERKKKHKHTQYGHKEGKGGKEVSTTTPMDWDGPVRNTHTHTHTHRLANLCFDVPFWRLESTSQERKIV